VHQLDTLSPASSPIFSPVWSVILSVVSISIAIRRPSQRHHLSYRLVPRRPHLRFICQSIHHGLIEYSFQSLPFIQPVPVVTRNPEVPPGLCQVSPQLVKHGEDPPRAHGFACVLHNAREAGYQAVNAAEDNNGSACVRRLEGSEDGNGDANGELEDEECIGNAVGDGILSSVPVVLRQELSIDAFAIL
jgi:hypothetical protein